MNWLKLQPHATICYDAYVCPYVKRVIDAVLEQRNQWWWRICFRFMSEKYYLPSYVTTDISVSICIHLYNIDNRG